MAMRGGAHTVSTAQKAPSQPASRFELGARPTGFVRSERPSSTSTCTPPLSYLPASVELSGLTEGRSGHR